MSIIITFNNFTDGSVLIKTAEILKKGGVIVYPTETFYALGVDATNKKAVNKLFDLKGRDAVKPILVLIKEIDMLNRYAAGVSEKALKIIDKFWPGPLTLIFKEKGILPELLRGGRATIGARISSHQFPKRFFNYFNVPLTTTSANISGSRNIVNISDAYDSFGDEVDIYLDGGVLEGKKGSAVIDATDDNFKIIREGDIDSELILDFLKSIE